MTDRLGGIEIIIHGRTELGFQLISIGYGSITLRTALNGIFTSMDQAKRQGGVLGRLKAAALSARAASAFAGLYMIPVKKNDLPASSRLEPAY